MEILGFRTRLGLHQLLVAVQIGHFSHTVPETKRTTVGNNWYICHPRGPYKIATWKVPGFSKPWRKRPGVNLSNWFMMRISLHLSAANIIQWSYVKRTHYIEMPVSTCQQSYRDSFSWKRNCYCLICLWPLQHFPGPQTKTNLFIPDNRCLFTMTSLTSLIFFFWFQQQNKHVKRDLVVSNKRIQGGSLLGINGVTNPYKWPYIIYKWVTGVTTPISGLYKTLLISDEMGPTLYRPLFFLKPRCW